MLRKTLSSVLIFLSVAAMIAAAAEAPSPGGEDEGREELGLLRGRAQWWFDRHRGPDGTIPWNARGKALAQLSLRSPAIEGDSWLPIGPSPIANGSYAYSGRITALATVPGSPNVVYAGAAQGGVWKTADGGLTWVPLTDTQDSLAIGAITIDPSNSNVVYAGTGEANQACDSYYGIGLLKTADAGATWSTLGASTFQNTSIAKIVVHPTIATTIYVANGSGTGGFNCYGRSGTFGVFKSIDGGIHWTQVLGSAQTGANRAVHDLVRSPASPDTLYAAVNGSGVWKTTNGGTTWTQLSGGLPASDVGRLDLAIYRPSTSDVLYVLVERASNATQRGTYRTSDGGTTFVSLPLPSGSCQYWDFGDICTYSGGTVGQCWYDLAIEVQSTGAVWAGGTALFRSTSGGASWTDVCPQSVHVDQHAIAFGSDGRVWIGNDGGVWASVDNGVTWTNKNSNLQITQFYPGASLDPSNYDQALAGAQDNGTPRFSGSGTWSMTTFGDGAATAIDRNDPATIWYTSYQYLHISKTINGGGSYFNATTGLTDADTTAAPFIGQFSACPANSNVLIAGSDNVWRTDNAAGQWAANSQDPLDPTGSLLVALAFAPSDPSCATYATATKAGRVFRTSNGGGNWQEVSGTLPPRAINDLAFDPKDANVLYVAVSGFGGPHLYRSNNALSPAPTWFSLDAGIPDAPINAVLVDPESSKVLYAGSDLGLFKSVDGGVSWTYQQNGIPRVAIYDLVAEANTRAIVAFTHGRGAFRLNLVCTPPAFEGIGSVSDTSACGDGVDVTWSLPASWGQLAGSGSYEVQRFTGPDCTGFPVILATGVPAETLSFSSSVPGGGSSSYRVIATNDCSSPASSSGTSACSPLVVDANDYIPCGDVGATLQASAGSTEALLAWGAVACGDLAGYRVYAANSYAAWFPSGWTLLGSPAEAAWSDALDSEFVAYRVVSLDGCGNMSEN